MGARFGVFMDQLDSVVVGGWHLQRVLLKKMDPFTHVLFCLHICILI